MSVCNLEALGENSRKKNMIMYNLRFEEPQDSSSLSQAS